MTKSQRRKMYLEAARAVLEEGRTGVFTACANFDGYMPELDDIAGYIDGGKRLGLPADLRAMLLILAATI